MTLREPTVRQTTDDSLLNIKDAKISGAASLANQRPLNRSQQLKAAPPRVTQRSIKCVHMVALMCVWVRVGFGVGFGSGSGSGSGSRAVAPQIALACGQGPLSQTNAACVVQQVTLINSVTHTHNDVFDWQASIDINCIK